MRISDWSSDVCSSDLAFGALLHYVLIISAVGVVIWLLSFPMGAIGGRVGFGRFVRAVSSSQAVALSTQSSLASLPAMLRGAEKLDIHVKASGIVLPLAVAIFRFTGQIGRTSCRERVCPYV